MTPRSLVFAATIATLSLASGCGSEPSQSASTPVTPSTIVDTTTTTSVGFNETSERPTLIVRGSDDDLRLRAFTSCWTIQVGEGAGTGECADGVPPDPLPSAGRHDGPIRFEFPLPDWQFRATMGPAGGDSGDKTAVDMIEPGVWEIELAGPAGTSAVHLSGSGPQGTYEVAFAVEVLVDGEGN